MADRADPSQINAILPEIWSELADPATYLVSAILRLADTREPLGLRLQRIGGSALAAVVYTGVALAALRGVSVPSPLALAIGFAASAAITLVPGEIASLRRDKRVPGTGYPKSTRTVIWILELAAVAVALATSALDSSSGPVHSAAIAVAFVSSADLALAIHCFIYMLLARRLLLWKDHSVERKQPKGRC